MPYVWDGHDNATRVAETGHGLTLHRYDWSDEDLLLAAIDRLISDPAMRDRLAQTSSQMQEADGPGLCGTTPRRGASGVALTDGSSPHIK